jgi:hypothetical protein
MADAHKYSVQEALNIVLNTAEDALKVDIDNVTLTTEGSDINLEVHTDKAEDSMLMFSHTVKTGSGGTSYVPLVDSDGHLQVDALSSALPSGAATAANQSTIIGHVDGIETLLTAANVDHAAIEVLLTAIDADTDAIKTAVQVLDDWDDSNYANVNINLAGSDAPTGGGAESGALRVTLANDSTGVVSVDDGGGALTVDGTVTANLSATDNAVLDNILTKNTEIDAVLDTIKVDTEAIETAVELLDNAISGSEMQVDVVGSLPAGSAAIGKLAANSGVDIGDVDVTSNVQPAGFGSIGHGNNTDVGTSAEVLASSQACKHIDVMAAIANTGIIYVGGSGVTAANGIGLYAGDVYSLDIDNVNDVYVVASVNGEDVQYVYYN